MEPIHNTTHNNVAEVNIANDAEMREKNRRAAQRGRVWLCAGVGLMGLSFGINFLMFHSDQSFTTVMYVMTTLGAVCIVKSLADLLGL
ncbi:MAG: hypothetical protein JNL02_08875 [Saprospiraceae bacterium]|nr:hypothetical protein [Saprospiraceae bacterium]